MTGTEFGTRERQNDDRTARRPIKQLPDELQQPLIPELAFVVEVFRGISALVVDVLAVTALQRAVVSDQLARVFGCSSLRDRGHRARDRSHSRRG